MATETMTPQQQQTKVPQAPKPRRFSIYGVELKQSLRRAFGLDDQRALRSYLSGVYSWPTRVPDELRSEIGRLTEAKAVEIAAKLGLDARVVEIGFAVECGVQFKQRDGLWGDAPAQREALFVAPATDPVLEAKSQRNGLLLVVPRDPSPVPEITDLLTAMVEAKRATTMLLGPVEGPKSKK